VSSAVLNRHRRDWEELAAVDPLWAILAAPERRWGRWPLDEFFATGEEEIAQVLDVASGLGYPTQHERALDFGCGVGRLTRALSGRFREAVGIDISEEMIRLARELSPPENCSFELNTRSDLTHFASASFDFVYSSLVLQHLPRRDLVRAYLGEFLRVLRPGGLAVFQALSHLPVARRLQPRRRAYALLHHAGLRHEFLLSRLKLVPVRLATISEDDVRSTVEARRGIVEHVEDHSERADGVRSLRYYVRV
jgi:ubiquinone/menaquinone biosynthesis C-methylase UbiE